MKGLKRLIFITLLICSGLFQRADFIYAQVNENILIGRIIDSSDLLAIPYATIQVKETNSFTLSNQKGIFEVRVSKIDTVSLELSFVGYSKKLYRTSTSIGDTIIIKMERQLINMDEVVVTAVRSERLLKNVPLPTQIISSKQMTATGLTNVAEIINSIRPGIDFYNEGRGLTFRMHGTPAKHTLFLMDGERIAGENRDNIDYSRLVSGNIERIEMVQGALSSLYGSSAMGGVVNLITRTPSLPFESDVYSRFSRFNELENGFNVGTKNKNFSYFADVVRKSSKGYDNTPQTPELYTVEPYVNYSFFNKAIFNISEKLELDARFSYYTRERFDVSGIPKHPFYTDFSSGLKTKYTHSEKVNLSASIYRDTYNTFDVLERLADEKVKVYNNQQITAKFISDINTETSESNKSHHITTGTEYFYDQMYALRIQDSLKFNHILSVFLQDELYINRSLSFTAGTRADFNNEYGTSLSPKASLMYKKNNMIYRASAAKGFRAPGIKERYYDFDLGFIVVKGNEDLVPEKSFYSSLAAEYLTGNTNISLVSYNNSLKNMIREYPIEGAPNQYTYQNFTNVNIYGIDILLRTKLSDNYTISSGYSYTRALDKESGEQLKDVSKHAATFSLDYFKRMESYTLGINLNGKIYGKKDFINQDEITGLFFDDVYNTYSIWKFSVMNKFYRDMINLTIGIDNIFNYKTNIDIISIEPGRRFFILLIFSLKKA